MGGAETGEAGPRDSVAQASKQARRAALSPAQIPHLVDTNGNFTNSPFVAGVKYYFSPAARRELQQEMRAQFEKFVATGLPFSHVDGHTHLHMHPVVFAELIKLCEEFGVKRVRVVQGEIRLSLRLDRANWLGKVVIGAVFNLLARHCRKRLRGCNFVVPEKVYGLLQTGNFNEALWLNLLSQLTPTSSEIYAHPLLATAEAWNQKENPHGAAELEAMVSPRVQQAIQNSPFALATYSSLAEQSQQD